MNLLTIGVVQSMIGASSYMKYSDIAMGIYRQAKAKGDESIMKRSLGYAGDSMSSAAKLNKKAQKALIKAQKKAREKAKAEQEAIIEKRRQEAAEDKEKEVREQQKTEQQTKETNSVATEISEEKQTDNIIKNYFEKDSESTGKDISTKDAVTEGIYTAQGEVKPASVEHKLMETV